MREEIIIHDVCKKMCNVINCIYDRLEEDAVNQGIQRSQILKRGTGNSQHNKV